jgi:F0F1-type ATP synthase membrane subunit b/b'
MIKMGANAIEEKYREDLSDELEEELKSLPAGLSEIQERFIESLKEEVAQGPLEAVPQAVERGQMLPVRNQCTDIPGHVTCFKELNGLIHGI